jgi:hypothetical protein
MPLKKLLSNLWRTSNLNHKLTDMLHLLSDDYVQRNMMQHPRYADPNKLNRYEFKVYSQNGEDGILQEIFERIGTTNKVFVEFGVGNGLENNTAFLLMKGWSGSWIEGSADFVTEIQREFKPLLEQKTLHVQQAFITAENIESLFRNAHIPAEFDLLSIDIDGNDYWVWKAITHYTPRVVVVEYNATFPPPVEWIKPYNAAWMWDGSTNFSASLQAYERLAAEKGYVLVGCNFTGSNAFFVRRDLAGEHFAAPHTAAHHYEPARYFLRLGRGHERRFIPTA